VLFGPNETRNELNKKSSRQFIDSVVNAQQLLNEQTLSIPKHIADATNELLKIAEEEGMQAMYYPDPMEAPMLSGGHLENFFSERSKNLAQVNTAAEKLEIMMRQYLHGDEPRM
jgi:hypothetical protein